MAERRAVKICGLVGIGVLVLMLVSWAKPEALLISQLKGRGIPNPAAWFFTRNYGQHRVIEAAQALEKRPFRSPRAMAALIQALNTYADVDSGDGIIPVRSEIALVLGRIGDGSAIKPLTAVLMSRDPTVLSWSASVPSDYKPLEHSSHGAAAEALGMFGPRAEEAAPHIGPLLKYTGESHAIRYAPCRAAVALGEIQAKESIPLLLEALDHPDCGGQAAAALARFGPRAKESLPFLRAAAHKAVAGSNARAIESAIRVISESD